MGSPRTELEKADFIRRLIDIDDWQITLDCFQTLEDLYGPHSVDCLANYYSKKLERYFSRFWNPGTARVDFFVENIQGGNCLAELPVDLVTRAIHYLFASKASATLVVPFWPSTQF